MYYKLVGLTLSQDIYNPVELGPDMKPIRLAKQGDKITQALVDKMVKSFVYQVHVRLVPFDREAAKKKRSRAIKRRIGKKRFLKLHT
jgi:hypothetical protein